MKKYFVLILYLVILSCKAQITTKDPIEPDLKSAVYDILDLGAKKDTLNLNQRYVHPEYGVYDVHRIGVPDTFTQHKSISFAFLDPSVSHSYPNFATIPDNINSEELTWYHANFDCNEFEWDREGFFITDSIRYPKLTDVIAQPVYETSEFSKAFIEQVQFIDKNSCRVVLTSAEIIFYLTKIEGRWFITLLDSVTTDCSA